MYTANITEVQEWKKLYNEWVKLCRVEFPNCQISGNEYQAQAIDWLTTNNELAGEWLTNIGVVYVNGSNGKQIKHHIM